ncbi:MAG TPA: thiamine phosphate synthase [Xanthobacteraceae bacterium]|nr:thiamine phosphate synthase [Xanthobacteraceae bacterium]
MVDLRLYALVDPERAGGVGLAELAATVARGGATMVQLRDKHATTRRMIDEARAIKAALTPFNVALLINDRPDVAFAARAHGVHVGQDDMAPEDARALLGPDAIIGQSIKTIAQAQAAPVDTLDYVCVGGVFATASKDNPEPPIGIDGLVAIIKVLRGRAPRLPIGAIAGIDETNAANIVNAGADGIAVISALSLAPDPAAAARRLRGIVDHAISGRAEPR